MEMFIAILISIILIGVPTYLIVRVYKKVDSDETIYTPEEIAKRLKKGYFLTFWGIKMAFGCVPLFALMFCKVPVVLMFAFPIGFCTIGLVLLFVGMVIVGTGTRYLNNRKRELTPLEEWTLASMNGIQGRAQNRNLANSISRATPGVTDDILSAIGSVGIVSGLFAIGNVYTGKNIFKKFWPIFIIVTILVVAIICSFI